MPRDFEDQVIMSRTDPASLLPPDEKHEGPASGHVVEVPPVYQGQPAGKQAAYFDHANEDGVEFPTEEEFHTLRRVSDKIPWAVYTIAFVELCERFSYYGTTVVCMFN